MHNEMVKQIDVSIDGEIRKICVGDVVRVSEGGKKSGVGSLGEKAKIHSIFTGNVTYFGVKRKYYNQNWGSLDGNVPNGTGLKLNLSGLTTYFTLENVKQEEFYVIENIIFKKKKLKGMGCKIVAILKNGDVFIELDKDIGGGSCDGLGKGGRCIVVKRKSVATKKTNPKNSKTQKRRTQ